MLARYRRLWAFTLLFLTWSGLSCVISRRPSFCRHLSRLYSGNARLLERILSVRGLDIRSHLHTNVFFAIVNGMPSLRAVVICIARQCHHDNIPSRGDICVPRSCVCPQFIASLSAQIGILTNVQFMLQTLWSLPSLGGLTPFLAKTRC